MSLQDFYRATTKQFYVDMQVSGSAVNIASDTMTLLIKDSDEIIISHSADMTTSGSIGRAIFNISSSLTNVKANSYDYEIAWHKSTGEDYVVDKSSINILDRVSGSI
jgi:hypothetical protein